MACAVGALWHSSFNRLSLVYVLIDLTAEATEVLINRVRIRFGQQGKVYELPLAHVAENIKYQPLCMIGAHTSRLADTAEHLGYKLRICRVYHKTIVPRRRFGVGTDSM